MAEWTNPRIAVLYQATETPAFNGVRTPTKLGGYKDSGADIAYALREHCFLEVISPKVEPHPESHEHWCFPDTKDGMFIAIKSGASHIWANTVVFENHPIQRSITLDMYRDDVRFICQRPRTVELFEDKHYLNQLLRDKMNLPVPRSYRIDINNYSATFKALDGIPLPLVTKPIRGKDSYGVWVCTSNDELSSNINKLLKESAACYVEQFLSGEEATVAVMPPMPDIGKPEHWALPIVVRFNHHIDVAPDIKDSAITANSRALTAREIKKDREYGIIMKHCEHVANIIGATAPIRIDVRRFTNEKDSPFGIFDVNFTPDLSGPCRPEREEVMSLFGMAAAEYGWDYPTLLAHILTTAPTLAELRELGDPVILAGAKTEALQGQGVSTDLR